MINLLSVKEVREARKFFLDNEYITLSPEDLPKSPISRVRVFKYIEKNTQGYEFLPLYSWSMRTKKWKHHMNPYMLSQQIRRLSFVNLEQAIKFWSRREFHRNSGTGKEVLRRLEKSDSKKMYCRYEYVSTTGHALGVRAMRVYQVIKREEDSFSLKLLSSTKMGVTWEGADKIQVLRPVSMEELTAIKLST